jgi:hypothetical protein
MGTECRYHKEPRHVAMSPAPHLTRRRFCIRDLSYLLHDSKPNISSLNRKKLLNAGTSMIGNNSDLSLTTGFVCDSSESEEDVLVLSAAAAGAAAVSFILTLRMRSCNLVESTNMAYLNKMCQGIVDRRRNAYFFSHIEPLAGVRQSFRQSNSVP